MRKKVFLFCSCVFVLFICSCSSLRHIEPIHKVIGPTNVKNLSYLDEVWEYGTEDQRRPLLDAMLNDSTPYRFPVAAREDKLISSSCSYYCGARYEVLDPDSFFVNSTDISYSYDLFDSVPKKSIEFEFPFDHPRVTAVKIVTGAAKTQALWDKYGRVRCIEMYLNDTLHRILHLQDIRATQTFEVDTLGRFDSKKWTLKFAIKNVYPGEMDTFALTDIYFDGLDSHSKISQLNGLLEIISLLYSRVGFLIDENLHLRSVHSMLIWSGRMSHMVIALCIDMLGCTEFGKFFVKRNHCALMYFAVFS